MQTSRRRGPCGRIRARAGAWQVGTEGGERGRCTWVPVGRGRRSNESSLVRSPDEADASTGKEMEQRMESSFMERGAEGVVEGVRGKSVRAGHWWRIATERTGKQLKL